MVQKSVKKGIIFFELEKTRRIIEKATQLEITWAYEDIVFVEHSAFLIRFDEDTTRLHCYFNTDCSETESKVIFKCLEIAAKDEHMHIDNTGRFNFLPVKDNDEIRIAFHETDKKRKVTRV